MDVLENGLRFQGEAVWWLPRALPPSSQGRDPCSSGGRHTWLPAGEEQEGERPVRAAHLGSLRPTLAGPSGRSQTRGTWARPAHSLWHRQAREHLSQLAAHPSLPHKCPIQSCRMKGLSLTPKSTPTRVDGGQGLLGLLRLSGYTFYTPSPEVPLRTRLDLLAPFHGPASPTPALIPLIRA